VRRVAAVHFLDEFGATEACWSLEVEGLPALVGIDAAGRSLFDEVRASSRAALDRLAPPSQTP
jgi:tartrate dehydratase beta subunit/fumarate hydratase class I family protein